MEQNQEALKAEGPAATLARRHSTAPGRQCLPDPASPAACAPAIAAGHHPLQISRATACEGRPWRPLPFSLPFLPSSPAAASLRPSQCRGDLAGGVRGRKQGAPAPQVTSQLPAAR